MPDAASLGETCAGTEAYLCAVEGGAATGVCDFEDLVCRPACRSRADCAEGEACFTITGGGADGGGKGYCRFGPPVEWTCDVLVYDDDIACDCGCGPPDPDCADPTLPVTGCAPGEVCGDDGACRAP